MDISNIDGIICDNNETVKYELILKRKGVVYKKSPFPFYKKNRDMTLISFTEKKP